VERCPPTSGPSARPTWRSPAPWTRATPAPSWRCSPPTPTSAAAVLAGWSSFFQKEGPELRWEPELAEISRSGDLGYTVGRWEARRRDAAGNVVRSEGRYVTIWRKEADGRFRVAVDAPLLAPGEGEPPGLERTAERKISSRAGDLVVEAGIFRHAGAAPSNGAYLAVRRRTRDGALGAALETLVPAAMPASD